MVSDILVEKLRIIFKAFITITSLLFIKLYMIPSSRTRVFFSFLFLCQFLHWILMLEKKFSGTFEGRKNFIDLICIISLFQNEKFIHIFYFLLWVDSLLRASTFWETCLLISPRLLLIFYVSIEWSKLLWHKNIF